MSQTGHIPPEAIDRVRLAADIADVVGRRIRLGKKGKDLWGLCPFHGDSAPSLKVDQGRGTWHCFGCGEGGSVFNFVMRDQNMSFPEAVRELAALYGVDLPRPEQGPEERRRQEEKDRLLRVLELAGTFFRQQLGSSAAAAAKEYLLTTRALDAKTVEAFGLGFAPEQWEGLRRHLAAQKVPEDLAVSAGLIVRREQGPGAYDRFRGRVMFPIQDGAGRVVSFGGRILGQGEPKYLNGPESPVFSKSRTLYNLHNARPAMRRGGRALVVEGYFDVITLAAQGFMETVAPLGTALTAEQVRILKSQAQDIVLIFDGDAAGQRAALRALPIFLAEGLTPRVLLLPQGEDPDSFVRSQGAAGLNKALKQARPLIEAVLDQTVQNGDRTSPEGKSAIVQAAGEVIKAISDPVTRTGYLERLAGQLALPPAALAARLGLPLYGGQRAIPPTPAASRGQGRPKARLHDPEAARLELALSSPAAARVLAQGGALGDWANPDLAAVAQAILRVLAADQEPTPEAVMLALSDQDLAKVVSRLAQCGLACADPVREANLHLGRWQRTRHEQVLAELTRDLAAAQTSGDMQRVMELQHRRKLYRRSTSPSPTSTGKD
ncbi:MAG: DNA primase [Desulfarculus sp.]|nr:DNA primase [Desulfarculus sp.]